MNIRTTALLIGLLFMAGCYCGCGKWEDNSSAGPFDVLKKSSCFRIGGVGYAAQIPPEHIALVKIMENANCSQQLEELFYKGSQTGKLYALVGLYYTDRPKYDRLSPELKGLSFEVEVMAGCLVFKQKVSDIVEEIEAGEFDPFFHGG